MLVPLQNLVDEREFRRLLIKHFPELEAEVMADVGLLHMEMAALERLANRSIQTGNLQQLKKTFEFAGDLARHQKELHPDVINAIHVSFLEGLNFANADYGGEAKALLPPVLLEMWNAQMEHNRKIGWLK